MKWDNIYNVILQASWESQQENVGIESISLHVSDPQTLLVGARPMHSNILLLLIQTHKHFLNYMQKLMKDNVMSINKCQNLCPVALRVHTH